MNRHYYAVLGLAMAATLVFAASAIGSTMVAAQNNNSTSTADSPSVVYKENMKYCDYKDGAFKIRAGVGSHIAPSTKFHPYKAEIKVSESVTWYNPIKVAEPHTVAFVPDQNFWPALEAPFVVSNRTKLTSAVPGANAEAITMPGPPRSNDVIVASAMAYTPIAISSNATVSYTCRQIQPTRWTAARNTSTVG
jgi:hypothetical protein